MIRTHVYIKCVGWVWKLLTKAQWLAMPAFKGIIVTCVTVVPPTTPSDFVPVPPKPVIEAPPPDKYGNLQPFDPRAWQAVPMPKAQAVPEPATGAILAFGVLVCVALKRSNKG